MFNMTKKNKTSILINLLHIQSWASAAARARIFIHGTNIVDIGLKVLFFGVFLLFFGLFSVAPSSLEEAYFGLFCYFSVFFRFSLSEIFSADALVYNTAEMH